MKQTKMITLKIFLLSFLIPLAATACDDKTTGNDNIAAEEDSVPEKYLSYGRVALSSSVDNTQPMTGIVFWAPGNTKVNDVTSLEFSYMLYNDVVKEKGVYDWSVVDNLLDGIASRKHQAVLRFRYIYPGRTASVPDYIKQEPDYEVLWAKSENRDTEFADWRCEELRRFHMEFHEKFAERYDKDPRLAFLQTGFGLWAEYHIYDGPFILGQTFPSKEFQKEFVLAMGEWFDDLSWSISIDASSKSVAPFRETGNEELKNEKFGLFDDSFMHKSHNSSNETWWNFFDYTERYKTSPHGGEFSYYSDYDQQHVLDKEGMYGRVFEEQAAKFHITYINGSDQARYQTAERIQEASMACGYRFKVLDFRVDGDRSAVKIANTGVAPIYRHAYVAVNGVRSAESLRTLYPGESVWVEIASGGADPVLTIECDHLVAGQKIGFDADVK